MVFFREQGLIILCLLAYRQHNLSIIYRSFETILHNSAQLSDTAQQHNSLSLCTKVLFLAMFFISSAIFSGVSKQYFKMFGSSKDVNKCILVAHPSKG